MFIRLYPDSTRVMTYSSFPLEGMIHVPHDIPAPESQPGKVALLHYSEEQGFWYEYVDEQAESAE